MPQATVNAPAHADATAAAQIASQNRPVILSGMQVVYGFLASLILTEYLKVASVAVYAGPLHPFTTLVALASFYLFYMIFDTIVWLILYKEKPNDGERVPERPRVEVMLWLLCRCVEFLILVWLYDFVNVVAEASKANAGSDLLPQLARLCLDIGAVCFGWAVWFALFNLTDVAKNTQIVSQEKREDHEAQLIWHVIFAALFVFLSAWFRSETRPAGWIAFGLTYLLTGLNVLRIYLVQKKYYSDHYYLYRT